MLCENHNRRCFYSKPFSKPASNICNRIVKIEKREILCLRKRSCQETKMENGNSGKSSQQMVWNILSIIFSIMCKNTLKLRAFQRAELCNDLSKNKTVYELSTMTYSISIELYSLRFIQNAFISTLRFS